MNRDTGYVATFEDVEHYATAGESEAVEFKETTGQRKEGARTLSGLLNGQGGMVLFGVRPDGSVVGQQVSDQTLEDVTQACRDIRPIYPPTIERVIVPGSEGKEVLVVSVPSGNSKPYSYKGEYFIRSGTSTVGMPEEIQLGLLLERAHGLDRWELCPAGRDVSAIDPTEVARFRDEAIANQRGPFEPGAGVEEVLRALQLLDDDGQPNRAAMVLFGRPEAFGGEYTVLGCQLVTVDGTDLGEKFLDERLVETNVFAGLRESVEFCRKHLARPVTLSGMQAGVEMEIPELVVREALANAFAHRDYVTAGRVQLRVFVDRIEVVSPGGLHFGLRIEDLYQPHTSLPWNPLVFGGLYRRGIVDQLGSGTLRMVRLCAEHGLGRPVFNSTPSAVSCAIPRRGYWISPDGTSSAVVEREVEVLRMIAEGPTPRNLLVERIGFGDPELRDLLGRLRHHGLVHPEGHGRGATWVIGPD